MEANALREFLADTEWGALDLLLVDLPPGTDRLATVVGLLPALAGLVVVTIPSDVSSLVVRKSITVAQQIAAPVLGVIENMAGLFPGAGGERLANESGVPFLGRVPFDPELAAAADRGEPYVTGAPEAPAARALSAIAARLRQTLAAPRS
jgi:ATP-binding protein involved in chromosome partitioning